MKGAVKRCGLFRDFLYNFTEEINFAFLYIFVKFKIFIYIFIKNYIIINNFNYTILIQYK